MQCSKAKGLPGASWGTAVPNREEFVFRTHTAAVKTYVSSG